jgi:hypothetical protein
MTKLICIHCPERKRELAPGVLDCPDCPPKKKPGAPLVYHAALGLALAMALLLVTVVYRARLEEPVGPDGTPVDPKCFPCAQAGEEGDDAEGRERWLNGSISWQPAAERNLMVINARLLKHRLADLTAAENLEHLRGRMKMLDSKVEEDVQKDGPLSDPAFRQRLSYATSLERTSTRPLTPELDRDLASDIAKRKPAPE